MKILTYNVNGLKSFYKKGLLDKLFEDFADVDIFCFQEVKATPDEVTDILKGYFKFVGFYDYNQVKSGYAGVLTIWKSNNVLNISGKTGLSYNSSIEYDTELSKYWYGRCVACEYASFNLINVYIPNSGNKDLLRQAYDESFLNSLSLYKSNKPLIIVGDMNVCSTELDYWGNYKKTINTCPGLMQFEIDGFHKLLESGFTDVYRELNPDVRQYSYYSTRAKGSVENNKGWRLDYVLVDNEHKDIVKSVDIVSGYNGADHSPIIIEFK